MELSYFGLSCFQIKTDNATVITDPFDPKKVGLSLPKLLADMVIFSDKSLAQDKGAMANVATNQLRADSGLKLVVVDNPGEYEAGGIFVRSYNDPFFHVITIEDVNICYLGMASKLGTFDFSEIGNIDYLIVPVGDGGMFLDWKVVDKAIKDIDPDIVIPCTYKLRGMSDRYSKLKGVNDFVKEAGIADVKTSKKLKLQAFPGVEEKKFQFIVMDVSK